MPHTNAHPIFVCRCSVPTLKLAADVDDATKLRFLKDYLKYARSYSWWRALCRTLEMLVWLALAPFTGASSAVKRSAPQSMLMACGL